MSVALLFSKGVLNWVHGGGISIDPTFHPEVKDRHPFEWRTGAQIGADESCDLVKQPNGLYAARSPNGKSWLSRQSNGSLQERATTDPNQPSTYETGPYEPAAHLWKLFNGDPVQVIGEVASAGPAGPSGPAGPAGPDPQSGFLTTSGHRFVTEAGADWLCGAYTMHTLSAASLKGEDLSQLLDLPVSLGFNTIVTINMRRSSWTVEHGYAVDPFAPGYQDVIARMYDACAARKVRVLAAALADCQGYSEDQINQVWRMNQDVARGRWNVLLRAGNEDKANGYDCTRLARPQNMGGVLCSRGSRGINEPPANDEWDFSEWEGRRTPYFKALDDAGAGLLELLAGYENERQGKVGPFRRPVIQIEPPVFNDTDVDSAGDRGRWTDPAAARHLGLNIAANCPGGAFLASDGMECKPLGDRARACAVAFLEGLRAGFQRPIPD